MWQIFIFDSIGDEIQHSLYYIGLYYLHENRCCNLETCHAPSDSRSKIVIWALPSSFPLSCTTKTTIKSPTSSKILNGLFNSVTIWVLKAGMGDGTGIPWNQGSARDLVHRWSTTGCSTLFSEVHSYDRWTLYTVQRSTFLWTKSAVHVLRCTFLWHWWYTAEHSTLFCDVHSYDHGALYRVFVYIDGTPQNTVHCSSMYIPMTVERCTGFSCTLM